MKFYEIQKFMKFHILTSLPKLSVVQTQQVLKKSCLLHSQYQLELAIPDSYRQMMMLVLFRHSRHEKRKKFRKAGEKNESKLQEQTVLQVTYSFVGVPTQLTTLPKHTYLVSQLYCIARIQYQNLVTTPLLKYLLDRYSV